MRSSRRTGRAGCGPIVEVPRSVLSTLKARFVSSAQTGLETALLTGRPHRGMGSRQSNLPPLNGTTFRERIWGWSKPREATNATRKEGTG